jgi:hypothetical protein
VQVKLVSARGLLQEGVVDRLHGLQARLLLPGRRPVLSGVVQLGRSREQEVVWEHEEQFTEVSWHLNLAVSHFVDICGLAYISRNGAVLFHFVASPPC